MSDQEREARLWEQLDRVMSLHRALEAEHQQLLGRLQKVSRQLRECARVADAFDKPEVATAYRWADAELREALNESAAESEEA